ncbi:MAG: DUF6323 family protein [Oliverpabstia sp.]
MDEKKWMQIISEANQLESLRKTNQYSEQFGLTLSAADAQILVQEKINSLKEQQRVEFGEGIMPKIIYEFCDSSYIHQDNYTDTLIRLQNIFYQYKNETQDEMTDDELLHFMKEQYETVCFGDLDYLEGTCLDVFARVIRGGYRGFQNTDGFAQYGQFDENQRWDKELYMEILRNMCWE